MDKAQDSTMRIRLSIRAPERIDLVALVALLAIMSIVTNGGVLTDLMARRNMHTPSVEPVASVMRNQTRQQNASTRSPEPFKIQAVVCTRVRNEAPYLREWIEYHRMIGFEAFLLMNDNSTDDTQCLLDAYAEEGIVIRLPQDFEQLQLDLDKNNDNVFDACARYLNGPHQSRFDPSRTWMSTHDLDEFMYFSPTEAIRSVGDAVSNILERYGRYVKTLAVPRLLFGSNGHEKYEGGLVIDRFNKRFNLENCPPRQRQTDSRRLKAGLGAIRYKSQSFHQSRVYHKQGSQHPKQPFNPKEPKSYCSDVIKRTHSYDMVKSFSNAASLAFENCETFNKRKEKVVETICTSMHQHTLKDKKSDGKSRQKRSTPHSRLNDKRYLPQQAVGPSLVIFHYLTKSRQEFMDRVCQSVWSEQYFRCPECNPERYFEMAQTFANNYQDDRMKPFSKELKKVLNSSSIGMSCDMEPRKHMPEYYQECLERGKQQSMDWSMA